MSEEDWRVEVELEDHAAAAKLHLAAGNDDADTLYSHGRRALRNRAALTHDGDRVFAYAATREDAEAAERTLRSLAESEQLTASFAITRWHPVAERWEDPATPLPADPSALAGEQEEGTEAQEAEVAEDQKAGVPEWEVRVTLPSHSQAVAFSKQLAADGVPSQRHWHYLLIGAWTQEDANALAERLRTQAPADSEVRVETTFAYLLEQDPDAGGPRFSPFVLF